MAIVNNKNTVKELQGLREHMKKKRGPGRPPGVKNKKGTSDWVKVGYKLSPEMVEYLKQQAVSGKTKSAVVDEALRAHKKSKKSKKE